MDAILNQPRFIDENAAREHLESIRWPNGAICPHCDSTKRNSKLNGDSHRKGLYFCGDCREQFTVTVGTVCERSKIPLHMWVLATHLICSSKKGMSSKQIERELGVTYKTAWFMTHRIREAMKPTGNGLLGRGGKAVEADETFIGRKPGSLKRRGYGHKEVVFSLVERHGNVRSFHVPDVSAMTLKAKLQTNVAKKAHLMTDDATHYRHTRDDFIKHEVVNHSAKEYVRGKVHTNTVDGFFSIFKCGIYGVYQHVSSQHLERYTTEFDFRYSHREKLGLTDIDRTAAALNGISGKRLTYRRPGDQESI